MINIRIEKDQEPLVDEVTAENSRLFNFCSDFLKP